MADPKWEDTEEVNFEDTEAIDEPSWEDTEPSVGAGEAALLGVQEGVSFGLDDIIAGAAGVAGRVVGDLGSPYTAEKAEQKFAELGITDPDPQGLLDTYYDAKKSREGLKEKASDEQTAAYYGGLLGGSLVGGGGATQAASKLAQSGSKAAQIAAKALPSAKGGLLKEGIKAGGITGLTEGSSELLRGDIEGTVSDVAGGAVIGGVAPKALEGAGKAVKGAGKLIGKLIPETLKSGFEYGKLTGKVSNIQDLEQDVTDLSEKIYTKLKSFTKEKLDERQLRAMADDVAKNISIEDDLQKASVRLQELPMILSENKKDIDKGLKIIDEILGQDKTISKLKDKVIKKIETAQSQDRLKPMAAEIKMQKEALKRAAKTGDQPYKTDKDAARLSDYFEDEAAGSLTDPAVLTRRDTIANIDPELPDTNISQAQDITPSSFKQIATGTTGQGLPFAESVDLGSGKLIRETAKEVPFKTDIDPKNLNFNEAERLKNVLNQYSSFAQSPEIKDKDVIRTFTELAKNLDTKIKGSFEVGDVKADIYKINRALDKFGVDFSDVLSGNVQIKDDVVNKLRKDLFMEGRKRGIDYEQAFKELSEATKGGFDDVQNEREIINDYLKNIAAIDTKGGDSVFTKKGLLSSATGSIGNVAGVGAKKAQDVTQSIAKKATSIVKTPAEKLTKGFTNLTKNNDTARQLAERLQTSGKAGQEYANALLKAADLPERSRNAVMYGLYQQPAFRKMVDDLNFFKDEDENVGEIGR